MVSFEHSKCMFKLMGYRKYLQLYPKKMFNNGDILQLTFCKIYFKYIFVSGKLYGLSQGTAIDGNDCVAILPNGRILFWKNRAIDRPSHLVSTPQWLTGLIPN